MSPRGRQRVEFGRSWRPQLTRAAMRLHAVTMVALLVFAVLAARRGRLAAEQARPTQVTERFLAVVNGISGQPNMELFDGPFQVEGGQWGAAVRWNGTPPRYAPEFAGQRPGSLLLSMPSGRVWTYTAPRPPWPPELDVGPVAVREAAEMVAWALSANGYGVPSHPKIDVARAADEEGAYRCTIALPDSDSPVYLDLNAWDGSIAWLCLAPDAAERDGLARQRHGRWAMRDSSPAAARIGGREVVLFATNRPLAGSVWTRGKSIAVVEAEGGPITYLIAPDHRELCRVIAGGHLAVALNQHGDDGVVLDLRKGEAWSLLSRPSDPIRWQSVDTIWESEAVIFGTAWGWDGHPDIAAVQLREDGLHPLPRFAQGDGPDVTPCVDAANGFLYWASAGDDRPGGPMAVCRRRLDGSEDHKVVRPVHGVNQGVSEHWMITPRVFGEVTELRLVGNGRELLVQDGRGSQVRHLLLDTVTGEIRRLEVPGDHPQLGYQPFLCPDWSDRPRPALDYVAGGGSSFGVAVPRLLRRIGPGELPDRALTGYDLALQPRRLSPCFTPAATVVGRR